MSLIYVYEDEDEEDAVYIYILGTWLGSILPLRAMQKRLRCCAFMYVF